MRYAEMNLKWIFILQLLIYYREACPFIDLTSLIQDQKIITSVKVIQFSAFPNAHNPTIIKNQQGFLLIFRYTPDGSYAHWISQIGIVQLDTHLNPVSAPSLLNTREQGSITPSQAEDARFFSYKNRLFLIYNDNLEVIYPQRSQRRDMFIAELFCLNGYYELSAPLKLTYPPKYGEQLWQKNWTPFVCEGTLYFSYSLNPHLVLFANLLTGECHALHETHFHSSWPFGELRGSSEAILVDGEYLSFFHSGIFETSEASWPRTIWHYFMGAYTFSARPPFAITRITEKPILTHGLYTASDRQKRVIFPGGFVVDGSSIYVAYGKDDCEMGIMILDKEQLKKALKPISR